ncbi:vesicle-associated protein 4-2-like [Syzygium oleosum]|uniref:vesicle-associated protein 4-2-like n=1 Tax=Syzygium oleosum TaxID=219896 RepID=UPI0011D20391|nr:vesicle-associated protein 4-2-like [Syzygium oleosum]
MALDQDRAEGDHKKLWSHLKMPFWQSTVSSPSPATSSAAPASSFQQNQSAHLDHQLSDHHSASAVAAMAKSLLPSRRRLRLDPPNKLFFPYEPGKQVRSAIEIKNVSKTHVAFKFQTTAPKSCYMRPPGSVLAPGENIIATVFKFVEPPESDDKPANLKSIVKFKILSLKVHGQMDYVPELFDELRDQVTVEKILRVVFLDPEQSTHLIEKLKRQLAEAEAALESQKKPPEEPGAGPVKEGLVIDEWKERRERYLAQQHVEGVDSV